MQHSRPTLAFTPLIPFRPLCIFLLCSLTSASCSWLFLYTSCFLFPLTPPGFFNGMLVVSEPEALNFYTIFRLTPLNLSISKNLTHLPLSRILDSLLCNLITPTSDLAFFSPDATHASGVNIFIRQSLSFSRLSISSLSSLDPLITSPWSHFLMFMLPPFALLRRIGEPTTFLPPFFPPPEVFLFWGTLIAIFLSESQKVLPPPLGRKYSIGSSPLTSSPSMTLTYLLFSIASLAVAPPLTSFLLPSLSLSLAPGRCFRTWVLITYQF